MFRAIKFISAFLGVALLIFLLIFGLNRSSFVSMFENREGLAEGSEWVEKTYSLKGLTDFIAEHPDRISITSIVVDTPDSSIYYGEDIPRTMGTLSNLFIFLGYADAFEQGAIDPGQILSWDEISLYVVPEIGESAHNSTYRYGRNQNLIDDDGNVTLEHALVLLRQYNSLALSDYLLIHLGEERIKELYSKLNLENTDPPLPFSGLLTTLSPSIQEITFDEMVQHWENNSATEFERTVYSNSERFSDGEIRSEWLERFRKSRRGLTFIQERDLLTFYPKTTVKELSGVMLDAWNGDLISESISSRVIEWLRYPMDETVIRRNFRDYGALYDNRVGLLNGVDFGVSAYTGDITVQAVFFDQMQIAVWFHMSSNHMHQDFQQRLIWDPALIETLKSAIGNTQLTSN